MESIKHVASTSYDEEETFNLIVEYLKFTEQGKPGPIFTHPCPIKQYNEIAVDVLKEKS